MDFILSMSSFPTSETIINAERCVKFNSIFRGLPLPLKYLDTFLTFYAMPVNIVSL